MTASAGVLVAAQHQTCAARHHGCGQTASIARCCCATQHDDASERGPAQPRIEPPQGLASVPAVQGVAWAPLAPHAFDRRYLATPRSAPVDRTTLFATLLI